VLAAAREPVRLNARRHGIVLARPLAWALVLGTLGIVLATQAWPVPAVGAALVVLAAGLALRAVVRWERTRVVVTTEKLFVVHGLIRRRAAAVRFERIGAVEVEQTVLGRALGYGTLVAGNLEIPYVADPRDVVDLMD
jgi:uncharacterized membrane protein YdbT with pleckstrin-like domain